MSALRRRYGRASASQRAQDIASFFFSCGLRGPARIAAMRERFGIDADTAWAITYKLMNYEAPGGGRGVKRGRPEQVVDNVLRERGDTHGHARAPKPEKHRELHFAGYDFTSGPSGTTIHRGTIRTDAPGDYGSDPLGDGRFRMVPSGDIVDFDEMNRRLAARRTR